MIISHSKKFIFFRVTKSGSTTAEVLLRLCGAFDLDEDLFCGTNEWELPSVNVPDFPDVHGLRIGRHSTPQTLIDLGIMTLKQLREYDCYAYLRPVESRFVSAYLHSMRGGVWGRQGKAGYQPTQFMEQWRADQALFNPRSLLGRAQVDWYFVDGEQLVQPVDFMTYQASLRFLVDKVGGYQFPEIPRLNRALQHKVIHNENRREWAKSIWNDYQEIRTEVLTCYAKDHAFYIKNFKNSDK